MNDRPVPNTVPPEADEYQFTLTGDDAVKTTVPVPQRDPSVKIGSAGGELMIASTEVLEETQPLSAST